MKKNKLCWATAPLKESEHLCKGDGAELQRTIRAKFAQSEALEPCIIELEDPLKENHYLLPNCGAGKRGHNDTDHEACEGVSEVAADHF